jgi:hypothetical protein
LKTTVRTLIGHRQLEVGLKCLPSLLRNSQEVISLVIHDDGSLTVEDCRQLRAALPGSTILLRDEADAILAPLLQRCPRSRAFRQANPLGLKLIDVSLLHSEDVAYCDSDILFLRPFERLFGWPREETNAIFMQDTQDAYALKPWHIYPLGRIRIPRRINAGLIFFRRSFYDLDFIEWMLGEATLRAVFEKRPHWVEQTCWAALGWRVGCNVWSPSQLMIANKAMKGLCRDTVGIHFVASYRSKLQDFLGQRFQERPAVIESHPARLTSPLNILVEGLRRKAT